MADRDRFVPGIRPMNGRRNEMRRRIVVPGELTLALGLTLVSFAIMIMVYAGFGISTISSMPFVLSIIDDALSFGEWNIIFQVSLLGILLAITRDFKPGYIVSFIVSVMFAFVLDVFADMMNGMPSGIWFRLLYFVISYVIMCFAIALMVGSKVPIMIVDSFINDLTKHFHVTFRRLKTIFDISCLSLSAALSFLFLGDLVGVGIGTVVLAIITGSGVHEANRILSKVIVIKPWSDVLERIAK